MLDTIWTADHELNFVQTLGVWSAEGHRAKVRGEVDEFAAKCLAGYLAAARSHPRWVTTQRVIETATNRLDALS